MALTKVTGQVIKSDTNITSHNINSSGIITAVSFSGPLDTTGGNFTGIITATSATFSGNVTIGGTLTYEDVTNIDSLGIVTARNGLRVTAGGINVTAGVSTYSALVDVNNRLDVVGGANVDQVNVTGVSTFAGTGTFTGDVSIADKIIHTGDTNTAIRFPANDTVSVETTGKERLYIKSDGKIGINTTTPNSALEVQGDGGVNDATITFTRHGSPINGSVIGQNFYRIGTDSVAGIGAYRESAMDDAYLAFHTQPTGGNYTERLRITSAGLVGLGTAAPTEKLHVIGQVGGTNPTAGSKWDIARFVAHDYSPTNSGGLTIGAYWHNSTVSERTSYIQSSQNTNSGSTARALLLNPDGGVVGIGTALPTQELSLHATDFCGIVIKSDRTTSTAQIGGIQFQNQAVGVATAVVNALVNGTMLFKTAGTERLRIDSSGNVGVGDNNPDTRLSVTAASGTDVVGKFTSTDAKAWIQFRDNSTTDTGVMIGAEGDDMMLRAGSNERLRIESDGDFRLSSGSAATNYGWIRGWQSSTGDMIISADHSATGSSGSNLIFRSRGSEKMRITSAGKIGINTDSPSAALTVSSPSGGLGDSTIGAGWLDGYDLDCIRVFHNATGRIGVYTIEQGDWSSGIVLGTIDGNTTRKWGIGMASNAKSAHNNGLYFGYRTDTSSAGANTFNTMRKDIIISSNGNVNIETGDLIMGTNNKGISFSNSSSSPDSNSTSSTRIMTDYDEGTCDWELHRAGALTTGDNSSDTRVSYTKIGNRVFMSGYVYTTSTGNSTGVVAQLTNASGGAAELPYTAAHDGVMAISKTRTIDDNWRHMAVGFAKDGKTVYVYGDDGNNAYTPEHNNISINSNQTHLVIAFSGSYETTE